MTEDNRRSAIEQQMKQAAERLPLGSQFRIAIRPAPL
jgi:hypothetical protein